MEKFCVRCGSKLNENLKCENCGYVCLEAEISDLKEKIKNYDYKGKFQKFKTFAKEKTEVAKQKYSEYSEKEKVRREEERKKAEILKREKEELAERLRKQAEEEAEKERIEKEKRIVIKSSLSSKTGVSFKYGVLEFISRFNCAIKTLLSQDEVKALASNEEFEKFFESLSIKSLNEFKYSKLSTIIDPGNNADSFDRLFKGYPIYNDELVHIRKNSVGYDATIVIKTDDMENIEWLQLFSGVKFLKNENWHKLSTYFFAIATVAAFNDETIETALFKIKEAENICDYYLNNGANGVGKSATTQAEFIVDKTESTNGKNYYSYKIIPVNTTEI